MSDITFHGTLQASTASSVVSSVKTMGSTSGAQQTASTGPIQELQLDDVTDAGSVRVMNKIAQDASKKSLADRKKDIKKAADSGRSARLKPVDMIGQTASQLSKRNPNLRQTTLEILWDKIEPGDKKEEILRKVLEIYPDPTDADDALEFLLKTTEGELRANIQAARDEHNAAHSKEIKASHEEALVEAESGTGISLKTWEGIKKFLSDQPDILAQFTMLEQSAGSFKEQKVIIAKLLHQLGEVSKAKGQGIEHGELDTNMKQIRFLQTHLGLFTFFRGRMALMQGVINNLNKMNG